jgi:hypothetical protein
MILRRFRSDEDGTFGTLELDGKVFFTVEKPWLGNKPFESCIPEGDYKLIPHGKYGKDGEVLAIIGDTVSHYQDTEYKRYTCLIHTANYPKDVVGCIGLGSDYVADKSMVTSSRKSIADFYDIIDPNKEHQLKIENADYIKD